MQRKLLLWAVLPALALGACGGAESGDAMPESPPHAPAAGTAADGAVQGGAEEDPAGVPAAELPMAELPGAGPASPATPSGAGAEPPAPAGTPPPAADRTAEEILRRAERAYADVRSMQADFVQHLTVPLLGTTQRSEGQLFQRRPDRFLMRFTDPAGDVLVADGRHFWMYNPSIDRTQVLRSRIADAGAQVDLQQQFLSNPTQRFVATLAGSETVDGHPTHLLSLVPRGPSPYRLIRAWIDQRNSLVRRFEMTEENGSERRIELRNLRLNVDLPDSLFEFTSPPGTQVFEQ